MMDGVPPNSGFYEKQNSFASFSGANLSARQLALERILNLMNSPERQTVPEFDASHVFQKIFADLFGNGVDGDEHPRFALFPHTIDEILSCSDNELPRYLFHRYRYDVYPLLHKLDSAPPCVQIEPTSVCNYRCVFCYQTSPALTRKSNGHMGHMTYDRFREIVDRIEGRVEFVTLASRGEPLICPEIRQMLAYAGEKFLNLKINTNAYFLNDAMAHAILEGGVKTVVFSADAAEEPLYSQLRVGGNLNRVLGNIEKFQKLRTTQYADRRIITRVSGVEYSSLQTMDSMQRLWGGLVDQVAFVKYNPWENVYNRQLDGPALPCSDLWRRMFVWYDGKVNPCDVDYLSTLSVGIIDGRCLKDIWRSHAYEQLRQNHVGGRRASVRPCNKCSFV